MLMSPRGQQGFSLMELAVVLMIIGTLMGGVLVAVSQNAEGTRRAAARTQLRQVEEALYGFAQSRGRLPCPATAASAGIEAPNGGGDCTAYHGFVPAATLGFTGSIDANGLLLDPWQNPVRYSVTNVQPGGIRFTDADLSLLFAGYAGGNLLRVCDTSLCTGAIATAIAPAIVFTMGANWATTVSADELENTDGDNDFVSTTYSEDNFDDQLVWLSPYILFNRMISAGQLP